MNGTKLSKQQEAFCHAFIRTGNASEAYREAYPAAREWKPESVNVTASKLLNNTKVVLRVSELREVINERALLETTTIIEQIDHVMMASVKNIIGADGKVLMPQELDDKTAAAVESFEFDPEKGKVKYKFHDKLGAIDKACRIKGLYEADNRQKNPVGELSQEVLQLIKERLIQVKQQRNLS